jgi:TRAP transporter TAXI family solute receptor
MAAVSSIARGQAFRDELSFEPPGFRSAWRNAVKKALTVPFGRAQIFYRNAAIRRFSLRRICVLCWPMGSQNAWRIWSLAATACVILGVALTNAVAAQSVDPPPRISFQISTGSTTGTYFPLGQRLAQLLSHPPGVGRCEAADACGPAGLIVTTRASEGSIANLIAVNSGAVDSGLAQTDVVAMAVAGQGPFRKTGAAKQLRVIANLYGEDVHLLAAKDAKITSVGDLKGKRVSLSTEGSGTINTARAILAAYRLSERTVVPNYDSADKAIDLLQNGKLDAIFFVGGTPVNLIEQMLDEGVAVLVPIDGAGRQRLLARDTSLSAHVIPEGTYTGAAAVETVSVDALWVTDAAQPDALIYGMVRALFNPANRAALDMEKLGTHFIDVNSAIIASAPLHPGAARYYSEIGILKAGEKAALRTPPLPKRS